MTSTPRSTYDGPASLSGGFRPFFFLGALYSSISVLLWLPQFYGELSLSTSFAPSDWHIHELYFGFLPAIITGFLLTAVPNWTGRLPLSGMPLLALVMIWVVGRLSIGFSAYVGWEAAFVLDTSFLVAVAATIAREIIAGKNWRNLKVLLPLILLSASNVIFHLEAHFLGVSDVSRRLAATAAVALILIVGGRVIPSFTRNWLARANPGRLPAPFSRFDAVSIATTIIALGAWSAAPDMMVTGALMAIAAFLQFVRLARWAGDRAFADPLVLVMHLSYLFIPVGLSLIATSILAPDLLSAIAGVHALTVGAIGGMTLSIMVRASLGHTGRRLQATLSTSALFLSVFVSASARIAGGLNIGNYDVMLHMAAFAWSAAFGGFAILFAPALLSKRRHQS